MTDRIVAPSFIVSSYGGGESPLRHHRLGGDTPRRWGGTLLNVILDIGMSPLGMSPFGVSPVKGGARRFATSGERSKPKEWERSRADSSHGEPRTEPPPRLRSRSRREKRRER